MSNRALDELGGRAQARGVAQPISIERMTDRRADSERSPRCSRRAAPPRYASRSAAMSRSETEHHDEEMPAMLLPARKRRQLDEARAGQALAIAAREPVCVAARTGRACRAGTSPRSGLEIGEPVVVPGLGNLVLPGSAPDRHSGSRDGASRAAARRDRRDRCSTAPPSPVVMSLTGWKDKVVMSASAPTRPAVRGAAERVRGVGDDDPAVAARAERHQTLVLARQAGEVDRQERARSCGRHPLHRVDRDVQGGAVDVREHGLGPLIDDRVGGRRERERRRDRLVAGAESGGPAGRVQRRRSRWPPRSRA